LSSRTEAAGANPEFPDIYTVLAAAHGHLGNAAARAALDELLRRMPGLTTGDERLGRPFGSPAQRELFLEPTTGTRRASAGLYPTNRGKNGPSIKRIGGLAPGLQACGHLLQVFLSSPALGER